MSECEKREEKEEVCVCVCVCVCVWTFSLLSSLFSLFLTPFASLWIHGSCASQCLHPLCLCVQTESGTSEQSAT